MAPISYAGSNFGSPIEPCKVCGGSSGRVVAHCFHGDDVMNTNTGETYLECKMEFFCEEHYPMGGKVFEDGKSKTTPNSA